MVYRIFPHKGYKIIEKPSVDMKNQELYLSNGRELIFVGALKGIEYGKQLIDNMQYVNGEKE